jgi:hypothetical protein
MENKQEDSVREAISLREPVPIIIEERVRHSASFCDVRNGSVVLSAMMLIYIAVMEESMAGDIRPQGIDEDAPGMVQVAEPQGAAILTAYLHRVF